jgi:hypothetical protein
MSNEAKFDNIEGSSKQSCIKIDNEIISSMYESYSRTERQLEKFSMWALVLTLIIGLFVIVSSICVNCLVSTTAYYVCVAFLSASCLFGAVSKTYALRSRIDNAVISAIYGAYAAYIERQKKEASPVEKEVEIFEVHHELISMIEQHLEHFFKSYPNIMLRYALWFSNKTRGNPKIMYPLIVSNVNKQSLHAVFQALTFLGFVVSGLIFMARI